MDYTDEEVKGLLEANESLRKRVNLCNEVLSLTLKFSQELQKISQKISLLDPINKTQIL